jgi:hypothetical protein
MVTVACEHSPIFTATVEDVDLLLLDFSVMESVIEWYNSLAKPDSDQAHYVPQAHVFCFPQPDGEWDEFPVYRDNTVLCPEWLSVVDACPKCKTYVPCDCKFRLVDEPTLKTMESAVLTNYASAPLTDQDIRDLIYTIRELEAQLKVEQEPR